jgi:hypothetical protein
MLRKSTRLFTRPFPSIPISTFAKKIEKPPQRQETSVSQSDAKFDYTKDKSMRTWGFNIFALICIVVASKEFT